MTIKISGDIDIDFADRKAALRFLDHIPASRLQDGELVKHASGVYFHAVPIDPVTECASITFDRAENLGLYKFDFLNVGLYQYVRNEEHLLTLMNTDPNWSQLNNQEFWEQLIHVGSHWRLKSSMPEPITNIQELAMFLAIIRPGKRWLAGYPWDHVQQYVWKPNEDDAHWGYEFKKAHAISYSQLVVVNMNLISSGELTKNSNATIITRNVGDI